MAGLNRITTMNRGMYCNADGPALELLLVPEAAALEAALASAAAARSNIDERSSGGAGAAGFAFAATGATGVAVTSIASKFGIAPMELESVQTDICVLQLPNDNLAFFE